MNEIFTVEEINLMCIFDMSGRVCLISELTAAVKEFDTGDPQEDAELREIAANAVSKLKNMSDTEFSALELFPEYSEEDYDEEV